MIFEYYADITKPSSKRLLGEGDTPCLRKGATRSEGGWLPIPVPVLVFLAPAALLAACDTSVPPLTKALLVLQFPACFMSGN